MPEMIEKRQFFGHFLEKYEIRPVGRNSSKKRQICGQNLFGHQYIFLRPGHFEKRQIS